MNNWQAQRELAVHLLRAGFSANEVAAELKHSPQWVRKCRRRYEAEGWSGLKGHSRAPHHPGNRIPETMRQAVRQARSELEAAAKRNEGLKYIGARAIRTRMKNAGLDPPSVRSIERILQDAGMTQPRKPKPGVDYPHLNPQSAHELCQVDHMPHYIQGGEKTYCFNAIDVVSRYPTGQALADRRSETAAGFLIHVWQTLGVPKHTQVDNEACFSGGFTHPHVLGRCVRLALMAGTELVFSPVRHPQSNGYVERFHRDYQRHVWEDTYLADRQAVQRQAEQFFALYRQSQHHSALQERSPESLHLQQERRPLPEDCTPSALKAKLPLYAGRIHFMRRIAPDGTISVLNVSWAVPNPNLDKGVWATVDIQAQRAILTIYDQPPDVPERRLLIAYPFPLSEPVLTRATPLESKAKQQVWFGKTSRQIGSIISSQARRIRRMLHETISWRL